MSTVKITDKTTPQAVDIEEAVLCALMLETNAIYSVYHILTEDSFYKAEHCEIFKAISILHDRPSKIDILTVTNQLRQNGKLDEIGGPSYISHITNRVASAANIEEHAFMIKQKEIARKLIVISTETITKSYDERTDVLEMLDALQTQLNGVVSLTTIGQEKVGSIVVKELINKIEKSMNNPGLAGIPSGLEQLDSVTKGWQNSDLIITAARPGQGKTAFAKKCALEAIKSTGKPVVIFSLEMSAIQLMARVVSEKTGYCSQTLLSAELIKEDFDTLKAKTAGKNMDKINELLIIDDTATININQLKAKAKMYQNKYHPCLFIVDYLQLISPTKASRNTNRTDEVSEISRGLKILAKELNVPVIALSQLNRAVELRQNKRPHLSDLRDSGAIEQDADMVLFLYRPYYYHQQGVHGFDTIQMNGDEISSENYAELIIAKHRNGPTKTIVAGFESKTTKFFNFQLE